MITAIIQARFNSQRLPGKVLLPLGGKTILENVVERVSKAKKVNQVIVATSVNSSDDKIADLCESRNLTCFRGDLDDVLSRFYEAAKKFEAKNICRITADCPLIAPELIDQAVEAFEEGKYDYISTGRIESTFPDGLDTEIFTFEALEKAFKEAKLSSEREHVTPYIWKNPDKFNTHTLNNNEDLSNIRLTVDESEDYELMKKIYEQVKDLKWQEVVRFLLKNKEYLKLNEKIKRDEGYFKSLKKDLESD